MSARTLGRGSLVLFAWGCTPTAPMQPEAPQQAVTGDTPSGSKLTASRGAASAAVPTQTPKALAKPVEANTSVAPVNMVELATTPATEASFLSYATLDRPLAEDCKQPYVLAASAPASAAKRDEWFWPWVVQAVVAHSNFLHIDATGDLQANEVKFEERATNGALSLVIHCGTPATCNTAARVLRTVVPKNQATVGCGSAPGKPTGRGPGMFEELELVPIAFPGVAPEPGSACARLAACARQQDANVDSSKFLACQAKPATFPIDCATQMTCHAVASCAKYKASSFDFAFAPALSEQLDAHAARTNARGTVMDVGGGGLEPGGVNAFFWGANSVDANRPGDWITLSLDVSLSSPNAEGQRDNGVVSWVPAFVERRGAHAVLGPVQSSSGDPYGTLNMPAFSSAFGHSELFDYDGDGIPELLLHAIDSFHTSPPRRRLTIWKYTPQGVVRYPGTEGWPAVDIIDADDDGRPDLVIDVGEANESEQDSSIVSDAWELAHSLPNGRFSMTDAVCESYNAKAQ